MSFFKSIGRKVGHFFKHDVGGGANKFFKTGKIDGQKLFGKGSIASQGLGAVSKGLGQAGSVLGSVAKVAGTVLNNPITQGALGVIAPEALVGADALQMGLKTGSSALKQGSQLTKQSTYRGNPSQVATNILERASGIANTVSPQEAVSSASAGTPATISHQGHSYMMM